MVSVKFIVEIALLLIGLALLLAYFFMNYESISKAFFEWIDIYMPK